MTSPLPSRLVPSPGDTRPGLLAELMSHTLDEDYRSVALARSGTPVASVSPGGGVDRPLPRGTALAVVLALFGLLLSVSIVRTEQDRPRALQERAALVDSIHAAEARYADLRRELSTVQADVAGLQNRVAARVRSDGRLSSRLEPLAVAAGTTAVRGPGVVVTVDDAPSAGGDGVILDIDLRALVNGLWAAGAEAVAVDGHRLTSLTSIRLAGQAITVGYRSVSPPYVVTAIGDPQTLPARLLETRGGQTWLTLKANFGIRFDTAVSERLTLPDQPREHLLHARVAER